MKCTAFAEYYDSKISYNHFLYTDMSWEGIEAQTHQAFEIIFVKKGDLTYVVNEKMYNVKDNSLILTRPNKTHIIYFNKCDYERYDIIFNTSIIHPEIYNSFPENLDVISLENTSGFAETFEKLDLFCNHFKDDALKKVLSDVIEEIFYYIYACASTHSKEISLNNYETDSLLSKSMRYIEKNLTSIISLEQMCSELYISKSYLHRIFAKHLQTTPKKYITARRLALAQKALQGDAKPTDVYAKCGFSDYSAFYRCYLKHFGYPPSKELDKTVIRIKY
ncbi:MAG: helix-turn-helix transcriptional regulator [Clostridia bacterium]|nr:helix-turn-helix transcriptional regulator [Clostridia bacterium]